MTIKYLCSFILMVFISACIPSLSPSDKNMTGIAIAASSTPISVPEVEQNAGHTGETTEPASVSPSTLTPTSLSESEQAGTRSKGTTTASTMAPISASATPTTYAYLALVTNTPAPITGQGIVADHTVIAQFDQIPTSSINAAAAKTTLFMHQSTGGTIDDSGLGCLAGLKDPNYGYPQECGTYAANRASNVWPWYDRSNWNWDMWPSPQADAMAKTDQFVDVVHARAGNYQIIGMKYCYTDGWNQSINVEQSYYITKMLALEAQYPGKIFIWTTSALWAEPGTACNASFNSCQEIADFNQQVRTYATTHNKPLYDIADIESHDQNGNPCTVQGYEGMCADWYGGGGGHPSIPGAIRIAKGFWWLMARISGWDGTSSLKQ